MISLPSGVFMSTVMLRLLGWRFWKSEPYRPPTLSSSSPGISTLTTWAPISESWRMQVGPERARVRSRTRMWDNGSILGHSIGARPSGPGHGENAGSIWCRWYHSVGFWVPGCWVLGQAFHPQDPEPGTQEPAG